MKDIQFDIKESKTIKLFDEINVGENDKELNRKTFMLTKESREWMNSI